MPKKPRNIFTFFCFWYDITFSLFNGSKYLKEQTPMNRFLWMKSRVLDIQLRTEKAIKISNLTRADWQILRKLLTLYIWSLHSPLLPRLKIINIALWLFLIKYVINDLFLKRLRNLSIWSFERRKQRRAFNFCTHFFLVEKFFMMSFIRHIQV